MEPTILTDSARLRLRGQDSKGNQASRLPRRAADEVRTCFQSKDRQADRPDDSAECIGTSGSGHEDSMEQGAKSDNASEKLMRKFFGFTLSPWPFVLGVVGAMLIALCTTADAQLQD